MGMCKKYYWATIWLVCWGTVASAQPSSNLPLLSSEAGYADTTAYQPAASTPFVIGDIYIEGNKKTKPYIIKRELPFKTGDSIYLPELVKAFEIAREQLMNTTLFNEAVVALKSFRGYTVDIIISVKERWYIFPLPYVKPIDRNITEWLKQGLGVDRLNYGFKFTHNNFTGRHDKLKLWFITGYTKQIEFQYEQPYADKSLKHGYKIGFKYGANKEVNYATLNNEQQFIDTLSGARNWYANVDYTYRPGLRTFNAFRLALVHEEVDSQILELNPKYYSNGKYRLTYPELSYTLNYYKVDYIPYPLKGWMGELSLVKKGFSKDMNMWSVSGKYQQSWPVAKKAWVGIQGFGVLRLPFKQPFVNQRMFGYSDMYLRGLENYVVDGVGGLLGRINYRKELISFKVPTYIKSRSHDVIPFRIYFKMFSDFGYAHNPVNPENSLTNRMLYTAGGGIDIVSFYDFVLRVDYSFNQLGQNGLFLHIKSDL